MRANSGLTMLLPLTNLRITSADLQGRDWDKYDLSIKVFGKSCPTGPQHHPATCQSGGGYPQISIIHPRCKHSRIGRPNQAWHVMLLADSPS